MNYSRSYQSLFSLALVICSVISLAENADNNSIPTASLKKVGESTLSYLFWDLYHARLYTESGTYQKQEDNYALEFNYLLDIKAKDLIKETKIQWRKQKLVKHANEQAWLTALSTIWPNVDEGDQILFYVTSEGYSEFYYNNKFVGRIKSEQFSRRFSNIWLGTNSTEPELRDKLKGL